MCGVLGYVGNREAIPLLLGGLRRLEYRGYDSAGIALSQSGETADTLEAMRGAPPLRHLPRPGPPRTY